MMMIEERDFSLGSPQRSLLQVALLRNAQAATPAAVRSADRSSGLQPRQLALDSLFDAPELEVSMSSSHAPDNGVFQDARRDSYKRASGGRIRERSYSLDETTLTKRKPAECGLGERGDRASKRPLLARRRRSDSLSITLPPKDVENTEDLREDTFTASDLDSMFDTAVKFGADYAAMLFDRNMTPAGSYSSVASMS